jgi:hypothetical protein
MIELSEEAMDALTSSHVRKFTVESWYNGQLLYDNIPFRTGFEEIDTHVDVQGRAELRLPRIGKDGFDWTPKYTTHPLAANGQRLRVVLGVGQAENEPDWFQRSWWRIINTTTEGDEVVVECADLMWIVGEADFPGPFQPSGTFGSTVRELVQPEINVVIDDDLVDRNIPSVLEFSTSRIQAFYDTLDAWPAEAFMGQNGYVLIRPLVESRTSLLTLTHGVRGTIIESSGTDTAEGSWNVVVVRGKDASGDLVQGVAYNLDAKHPKQYGGPFSKLPLPYVYESDMVDSLSAARATANSILQRKKKYNSVSYQITLIPHPALQVGDVITINTDQEKAQLVEITRLSLPYTHDGGAMHITVRTI